MSQNLQKQSEKPQEEITIEEKQKDEKKVNRSKSLIKKKILRNCSLRTMDFKHFININDTLFINQETLKDYEASQENIQRSVFRFKMISKIVLNSSFVGLQLKKVDDNYLPLEYFVQRFRSFGDQQMAEIANGMQKVFSCYQSIKKDEQKPEPLLRNDQAIQSLNQFLKQMQGRMYIVYYLQIWKKRINLKHIFFSVNLLQKLGWNIKRVAMDFLKYRHVFFEIFSPKNYKRYILMCFTTFLKAQQVFSNPNLTQQQKVQLTSEYFDDEVVRQVETQNGTYEEFLKVKVKFSFPHTSYCCVQILKIQEDEIDKVLKKRKLNKQIIEVSPEQELCQLKNLGFESSFLELDNLEVKE